MKRIALSAGAVSVSFATPALAMDEGAIIAMLSVMGASVIGVIGGAIFGWLRRSFLGSLGWTFAAGAALMMIALLLTRIGFKPGEYVETLVVACIVATVPLALAFAVAYGGGILVSNRARKASE